MQIPSAKEAKYDFDRLIDLAHADPVAVAEYGQPFVSVFPVENTKG